jgi:acyl-CoA synthetase (AMP-forming)/AMP-acid ligase II
MPGLDEHVRAMVEWHFDERTGSPFWLARAKTLGFDPLREVRGFADLARFPDVGDEWRTLPGAELIPRGLTGPARVWESAGTTGVPRRVVLGSDDRYRDLPRLWGLLDQHGFPSTTRGDAHVEWLHIGPSGPHQVWWSRQLLAWERGTLLHMVDLDPRWVKRLYRDNRAEEAGRYLAHVLDQVRDILRSQKIGVISSTPPLVQALCDDPELYELVRKKVRGIVWAGTSLSDEALRFLEEDLLPGVAITGVYGNTLMNGTIWQVPRREGDAHRCTFGFYFPEWPGFVVRLVSPETREDVPHGAEGQVLLNVLQRTLFLPNHLERDVATRVAPADPGAPDRLARVRPVGGARREVEGVY